ncbi:hypothetical protein [Herminiimonas arsenitoxidans]|uniref:hypothetical protein n=1 Tax=Herminiimonas arsenitoxidans TaxID=1809410 RepID=UPI0009F86082|nr:hypothetical protein [Herminiimonas arsenitoxidans]
MIRLLNFQSPFVPMIEAGQKPHTIRAFRTDGKDPEPGDTLHLYYGLRTKSVRLLAAEPCQYATEIMIQPSAGNVYHVLLGGRPLEQYEIEQLARNDGFTDASQFMRYFESQHTLPFKGLLIGWNPIPVYATKH